MSLQDDFFCFLYDDKPHYPDDDMPDNDMPDFSDDDGIPDVRLHSDLVNLGSRALEDCDDVFADLVNVLLFDGRSVVRADDLQNKSSELSFEIGEKTQHGQERDVTKYWHNSTIHIRLFGFADEPEEDSKLPLYAIGCDGKEYRGNAAHGERKRYPVVSLMLYFGEKRWDTPLTLLEQLDVPDELRPFVNDYRVNLREIAFLREETVAKFQSDFRIIADYLLQKRTGRDYIPPEIPVRHVRELLELMTIVTHDPRYKAVYCSELEEGITMREIVDRMEHNGIERAAMCRLSPALNEGRVKDAAAAMLMDLVVTMQMTEEQAMEALKIPEESRDKYAKLLKEDWNGIWTLQ